MLEGAASRMEGASQLCGFYAGTNGSGKSAVLQAVQFCLGVSAAKTGRAGSNQNFIKSGCHEAKVGVAHADCGIDVQASSFRTQALLQPA